METIRDIVAQFQLCGDPERIEPFGAGNINDTYRSIVRGSPTGAYIHQKINQTVFRQPVQVMENMARVTGHIRKKLRQRHSTARKTTLELIPTKEGKSYYVDTHGEYWRTTIFIPDAVAYNTVQHAGHAYEVGKTLGEFQRFVADIPPTDLHDTLPGFHHTPVYYNQFWQVIDTTHPDPAIEARKRNPDVIELIQYVRQHESLVSQLMEPYHAGTLRERVVHNDPKANNILLDTRTHKGICIIDLDTVKSGLIHFDYGDCLRTAANPVGEDIQKISQVHFDLNLFEWITKGYLEEARLFLSQTDIDLLVDSVKVITFEQAIRFLTDYVRGDVYYKKISYPKQNLHRARVQFVLLRDIEAKDTQARRILKSLLMAGNL